MQLIEIGRGKSVLVAFCLFVSPGFSDAQVPDQTLVYKVSYGNKNADEITIILRNDDEGYVLTSTTKPSKLAGLFLKAHTSDTKFIWRDGKLAPLSATEKLQGKESYDRGFQFDYDNKQVEFVEGKVESFEDGDQFESVTFPLLLMHRPIETVGGMQVKEVSPKRFRGYTYAKPAEEIVNVPAGEFRAWKIIRFRTDKPEDTVTVWLDKSDNPVPVKIVVYKKGKTSSLDLTSN